MALLCIQTALFAYNYATESLDHSNEFENPFVQYGLFSMSSSLYMALVIERTVAVRNAAKIRTDSMALAASCCCISSLSLGMAGFIVYSNYWLLTMFISVAIHITIEGFTLVSSISLTIYARRKYRTIPYDSDRLKAKYQVKEVLEFSMTILPSVIIGAILHALSFVPTLLWIKGIVSFPIDCVIFCPIHSLNCVFTKITLIGCHKEMRQRFEKMFFRRSGATEVTYIVVRDAEGDERQYFEQMKAAWDLVLSKNKGITNNGVLFELACFFYSLKGCET